MCTVKNLIILGEETNFALVLNFVSLETVIYTHKQKTFCCKILLSGNSHKLRTTRLLSPKLIAHHSSFCYFPLNLSFLVSSQECHTASYLALKYFHLVTC
jgi:hypothetical protein